MHADWRLYGDLRDIAGESVTVEIDGSEPPWPTRSTHFWMRTRT